MSPHAQEITFIGGAFGSAVYTMITGDTFLPSLAGGAMAVVFRLMSRNDTSFSAFDLLAVFIISMSVGNIAGPYVGSLMPEGDGVVGVGTLFTSFIAVRALQALHAVQWDFHRFLGSLADGLKKK